MSGFAFRDTQAGDCAIKSDFRVTRFADDRRLFVPDDSDCLVADFQRRNKIGRLAFF